MNFIRWVHRGLDRSVFDYEVCTKSFLRITMSGGFDLLARLEARNTAPAPAPNTDNDNATAGSFGGACGGFDLLARLEKRDDDPTLPAVQTNGAAQALQAANARMQLLNGSDDQPTHAQQVPLVNRNTNNNKIKALKIFGEL